MPEAPPPVDWTSVQAKYADIPGEEGVALRQRHYSPFFLRFGRDVRIEERCRFFRPEFIVLEDDARINIGGLFYGSGGIVVGRHARIGPRCFVHSANHDVATDDPRAFFERGYEYRRTVIGDNCLVSANASLLPGAVLGAGSFVACGAVVSGREYAPQRRLFGVPATHRPTPQQPPAMTDHPEVAFIVPPDRPDLADAVDLLREVLGLVQAIRLTAGEPVPVSVAAAVCLGDARPGAGCAAEVWRVVPGEMVLDPTEPLALPRGERLTLSARRDLALRSVPGPEAPAEMRLADLGFWLHARLFKRASRLRRSELREWLVVLILLDWPEEQRADILARLQERRPDNCDLPPAEAGPPDIVSRWLALSSRHQSPLHRLLDRFNPKPAVRATYSPRLTRKQALAEPVDLVIQAAAAMDDTDRAHLSALLDDLLPHCNTSLRLVAIGLAAHLLDRADVAARSADLLNAPGRWPSRGGVPLNLPGCPQLLLSPLYAAWLLLVNCRRASVPEDFMRTARLGREQPWHGFTAAGEAWSMGDGHLVDEAGRRISEDLLVNWLGLQTAPCAEGHCLELVEKAYEPHVDHLERVWSAVLHRLLERRSRPLIRLQPWPAPHRAALSLRYDVDRAVTAARLEELVRLQGRYANAPIGSWYFRRGNSKLELQRKYLDRAGQDVGIHIEQLDEVGPADRVTHHSAPTSVYWQGDRTTHALAAAGAAYGEFHSAALPTPRRAWLAPAEVREGLGRLADVTLTALHFPLEGGTDDYDLSYFDRLLPAFRQRLEAGGHVIVGSHPDLDQALLVELLAREDLSKVWKAPVADVVRRWRDVMTPGQIKIVSDARERCHVLAVDVLADVQVIVFPVSGPAQRFTLQLTGGLPRCIEVCTGRLEAD